MANIQTVASTSDVVTLGVDSAALLSVGQIVIVTGTVYNKVNGHHQLTTVNTTTNKITYDVHNLDDITEEASSGVVAASVSWCDEDDVEVWLGIETATANDQAFLAYCTEAGNSYAFRLRYEAGYKDSPLAAPSHDTKLGTIQLCAIYYRQRGSVDSFSSFEQLGTGLPFGSMATIRQLLGVNKPQAR
jgi:hypothetical protein